MSSRRRRDKRRRHWSVFVRKTMWYSISNCDTLLTDGTIVPGARYEMWSGRLVKLHG